MENIFSLLFFCGVCVCAHMFLWHMWTHICIMTWVWRYYLEKVIYEDILSVPIIQKAYKSYIISFFEKVKCKKFPVRSTFRCRAIENASILYSIKQ